jgi:hypothetical protein
MQSRYADIPGCKQLFFLTSSLFPCIEYFIDSRFDRKYGINTSGYVSVKDMDVVSKNTGSAVWYEPTSVKVFNRIMSAFSVNNKEFTFIDFGSGKGRILILASQLGFNKVIGVEFAQNLHHAAVDNVSKYKTSHKSPPIEPLCEDATKYILPNEPLVIFFFEPFTGKVMEQVLMNISESYIRNPRRMVLIFYGELLETIELMKTRMNIIHFQYKDLPVPPDWARIRNYPSILFFSPELSGKIHSGE